MTLNPMTQARIDAYRKGFSLIFREAYSSTDTVIQEIATTVPSEGIGNVYGWSARRLSLRPWVGPRTIQNIKEHVHEVKNLPFEGTVELDLDRMSDDQNTVKVFASTLLPELASAAAEHPDDLLVDRLQENPDTFDGVPWFSNAHPTYCAEPGTPDTYSNTHTLDLSADNLNKVWAQMVSIIGENGKPLGVRPTHLMVAPQLLRVALEILSSSTYAQSTGVGGGSVAVDNPMKGWLKPIVNYKLASDPWTWYVFDASKPIKPVILQRRSEASLVARDQLTDPKVFEEKKLTYGVDYRGNVVPSLPFLSARSIGSEPGPVVPGDD